MAEWYLEKFPLWAENVQIHRNAQSNICLLIVTFSVFKSHCNEVPALRTHFLRSRSVSSRRDQAPSNTCSLPTQYTLWRYLVLAGSRASWGADRWRDWVPGTRRNRHQCIEAPQPCRWGSWRWAQNIVQRRINSHTPLILLIYQLKTGDLCREWVSLQLKSFVPLICD